MTDTICVLLSVLTAAAVLTAVLQIYYRKQMYLKLGRMLDQVLERREIGISDVREGALAALANKAVRIQEKLEYELNQAQNEKEQVKSLISNMSHQLKTPLGNVMMYRELLETQQDVCQHHLDKTDWILQYMFKMTRLEQGAIQFEAQAASIKNTLLDAVNSVYERAEKKKIQISAVPFEDIRLLHNPKWTAEVFCNILENAVKYSKENSRIQIQVIPMELYTEIQISDEGIGIHKEELTQIFKRFYRSREVENMEGSGIGLYLARLILEKEKGYMTVTSEYGKGSSFHVFLQNCQN